MISQTLILFALVNYATVFWSRLILMCKMMRLHKVVTFGYLSVQKTGNYRFHGIMLNICWRQFGGCGALVDSHFGRWTIHTQNSDVLKLQVVPCSVFRVCVTIVVDPYSQNPLQRKACKQVWYLKQSMWARSLLQYMKLLVTLSMNNLTSLWVSTKRL